VNCPRRCPRVPAEGHGPHLDFALIAFHGSLHLLFVCTPEGPRLDSNQRLPDVSYASVGCSRPTELHGQRIPGGIRTHASAAAVLYQAELQESENSFY
jgi:hypothetical protein